MEMLKEELAEMLAKKLARKGHVNIIEDEYSRQDVLKDPKLFAPLRIDGGIKPIRMSKAYPASEYDPEAEMRELEERASEIGANYLFIDHKTEVIGGDKVLSTINAHPYAIIGDYELKLLEELDEKFPYDVCIAARQRFYINLETDHMDLYFNDTAKFKDFFYESGQDRRTEIVKEVLTAKIDTGKYNPEMFKWLSLHYRDLIERVAATMGTEGGP